MTAQTINIGPSSNTTSQPKRTPALPQPRKASASNYITKTPKPSRHTRNCIIINSPTDTLFSPVSRKLTIKKHLGRSLDLTKVRKLRTDLLKELHSADAQQDVKS